MLKTLTPFLSMVLLAASTSLYAQAPQGGGDAAKGPRKAHFDCSQAKDPKACEERRAKMKAAHEKAVKACEGKKGAEHTGCMRTEMCAQSKDPKACEAKAKEAAAKRDAIREACKDKKGDEFRACAKEQRGKK